MVVKRRDILKVAVAAPFIANVRAEEVGDYTSLSVAQAATAIRKGGITAETYVEQLIGQDRKWATLNAFISRDHDALREAAFEADKLRSSGAEPGPLHGVPLVFKDNIATAALPTTAGTGALRDYQPKQNAVVAQKLFDAGALLFGKNNMHELAAGITTNNLIYGPARNPYNQAMMPGGSSGGTAASIAARVAPAGLGTDTGGSVRIPASLCGISGLRPTTGRYSGEGLVPFQGGTAIAGPLARTVEDLALLDGIITGETELPAIQPAQIRLGVPEEFLYEDIDSEVARIMGESLDRLEQAGVVLVRQSIEGLKKMVAVGRGAPASEETVNGYAQFFRNVNLTPEDFVSGVADPAIRARLNRQLISEVSGVAAVGPSTFAVRARYKTALGQYFESNNLDAMIIPPTPLPARPIGQDDTVELNGRQVSTFGTYVRNCAIGSAAALPGVVIPAGMTNDGLPLGIELDGPMGSDRRLLAIAGLVEATLPAIPPPVTEVF
jgi:Asp-tRNA(Asn)/Glu-tRNA(Gln) amidotransferase A subunit family amidase